MSIWLYIKFCRRESLSKNTRLSSRVQIDCGIMYKVTLLKALIWLTFLSTSISISMLTLKTKQSFADFLYLSCFFFLMHNFPSAKIGFVFSNLKRIVRVLSLFRIQHCTLVSNQPNEGFCVLLRRKKRVILPSARAELPNWICIWIAWAGLWIKSKQNKCQVGKSFRGWN